MGKGIQISFSLDPREFVRGLKVIETGTEDVAAALDDLGDADVTLDTDKAERGLADIEDAAEDTESALDDLGRKGERSLDDVESAAKSAGREVEDELEDAAEDAEDAFSSLGRSAANDIGKVEDAADRAGREVGEIEEEAADSAKEFGASFRGDPIEALEEVQALAAELANKLIPGVGGAVAAIAGGVGFGALLTFYENWKEKQEEINERVRSFRDEILDTFGVLDKETITRAFIDGLDEAGVSGQEFADILAAVPEDLRVGFRQALQSGDLNAMADIAARVAAEAEHIETNFVATGQALTPAQQGILDLNDALGGTTGELSEAVGDAQALSGIIGNDVTNATDDATDSAGDLADEMGNAAVNAGRTRTETEGIPDPSLPRLTGDLADAEDASAGTKGNVAGTNDKNLPRLTGDLDDAAGSAGDTRADLGSIREPSIANFVQQAKDARDAARGIKDYWDGIGNKSITVDINYRTRGKVPDLG